MTIAYREIAFPAAILAGAAALVVAIVMEVRHARQRQFDVGASAFARAAAHRNSKLTVGRRAELGQPGRGARAYIASC